MYQFINEFQRSIMPLIIINSIFCTGLIEYFENRSIRTIGYFYVALSSIYYGFSFVTFKNVFYSSVNIYGKRILRILVKFQQFNNSFLYIMTMVVGLTRRKHIKVLIKHLEGCTRGINELNGSRNYFSLIRYQCIACICYFFIIIALLVGDYYWFSRMNLQLDLITTLRLYYCDNNPFLVTNIIDLTFIFWVRYIKIKFNELNGLLEKMLTTTVDLPQHTKVLKMKDNWEDDSSLSIIYRTYKANENLIKLKRIKQIHLELMKSSKIINEAYGLPIFISVIEATSFTITLFYNLYNLIILNKLNYFILDFYTNLYWIFVYAFKIFLISNICETAITEAGNTGNILCELYEPSTSKKFREQIRDFMFQLIRNRLTFTACGFFDLDHTFLYSVIGSITTYLVILIQVGDEPNTYYNNTNDNSTSNNLS